MEEKRIFTKTLAVMGTALVWLPILFPLLLALVAFIRMRMFRLDFFIPAELFPVVLAGAALLLWAALRAKKRRGLIGWGAGIAIVMLFGSQGLAVATGMASGEIEPAGWLKVLVMGGMVAYDLAAIVLGVGGVLLLRDLFKPVRAPVDQKPPAPLD